MELLSFSAIIGTLTVVFSLLAKVLGQPDQIRKNFKRKSTEGLSTIMITIAVISYLLWTIHGIIEKDWVLIIGQSLGVLTSGIILMQIIIYRDSRNK